NTVGGTTPAAANIIGWNTVAGVQLIGTSATSNVVEGNHIGTDASGGQLPNFYAVQVFNSYNNTIGGTVSGSGTTWGAENTIGFNPKNGIAVLSGSGNVVRANEFIGTNGPLRPPVVYPDDIGVGPNANNEIKPPAVISASLSLDSQTLSFAIGIGVPANAI